MDITRIPGDGRVRLALRGRFDAAWSAPVQEALAECVRAGQHEIELDLAEVAFLSSAGIRVLLLTYRQLSSIRGRLSIVAASPEVRQVIELSGLRALLAATPAPHAEAHALTEATPRRIERVGARYDVYDLAPAARITVRSIGDPAALLGGGALAAAPHRESFPSSRLAVGVGAFDPNQCETRLGELMAIGGAAITLPTSGEGKPDWLVCEERLVPVAHLAYGLVGDGSFARHARFEALPDAAPLSLAELIAAALEIAAAPAAAVALIGEAAQFVGASLRRSPIGHAGDLFAFPGVREGLDFTAEPAHAGCVGLVVGFAARRPTAPPLSAHLRPLEREGDVDAHLHAAVFPYRPVRRGLIGLDETVRALFDGQSVLGLLHLINDWRPASGAGQTAFHRGALWCAPLTVAGHGGTAP